MFSMKSSFRRYKAYADILGGSPSFCDNFRQTYVYLSPDVVHDYLNSCIMTSLTWAILD